MPTPAWISRTGPLEQWLGLPYSRKKPIRELVVGTLVVAWSGRFLQVGRRVLNIVTMNSTPGTPRGTAVAPPQRRVAIRPPLVLRWRTCGSPTRRIPLRHASPGVGAVRKRHRSSSRKLTDRPRAGRRLLRPFALFAR